MAEPTRVDSPREGLPDLVVSDAQLERAADMLAAGTGPVALDAERASGFRYGQRAYLVQLRRVDGGTHLVDPTAFDNLDVLHDALSGVPWILHAASQDLVCLAETGLRPTVDLYDTELAGRLLGLPRVGLGPLVEAYLDISLAKEHSAADWSTRPLPDPWLHYAALDVEFLPELWELMHADLHDAGKADFAYEEFAHVRDTTVAPVRVDPWRRTSGLHKVHHRSDLAVVRDVWHAREKLAVDRDVAPGRLLTDAAIVAMALARTDSPAVLRALPELAGRGAKRHADLWVETAIAARALPETDLPEPAARTSGVPAPRVWAERNPAAFARLEATKVALGQLSDSLQIPVENLMTPDVVRRALWEPPDSLAALEDFLAAAHARPWQRSLVGPIIAAAIGIGD